MVGRAWRSVALTVSPFWASSGSVNINSLHVSSGFSPDWETRRDKLNIEQDFYLERCDIGV